MTYGAVSYTHNANGDLLTSTSGGETTTYTSDVFGNLTSVTLPNTTTIAYLLDGQNRRIGKKVNNVLTQGFLYGSQLRPAAELDGTGALVSRFVYGTRINVPDSLIKTGATYRPLTDHLGSVRLVINTATGAIAQRLDYDEFGQVTQDTNPGFQPFGFAGGIYDPDTKLVRFGARDYDAFTGRWTAKDPMGFASGQNLYSYIENGPIDSADPLGLQARTLVPKGPGVYGGGPGTTIGSAAGWVTGAYVGYYAGVAAGVELGITHGGTLGLAAGPLGSLTGAAVGGIVGGIAGGMLGGFVGSNLGGDVGGWFDSPCAGVLNCNEFAQDYEPVDWQQEAWRASLASYDQALISMGGGDPSDAGDLSGARTD